MPEIIEHTTFDSYHGHFVIAAITKATESTKEQLYKPGPLEVQLLVNGLEVPFTATIEDLFSRMDLSIDRRAKRLATEMLSSSGLDGIRTVLEEAEWKIKNLIDSAFGKEP